MWTLIGLATARHQVRVGAISIARVTARAPVHSGAILQRGFAESKRRSAVAAAPVAKPKATRKTKTAVAAAKPKKKPVAKKAKAKAKVVVKKVGRPKKKVLTDEEKRVAMVRRYKATSLIYEQPAKLPQTARHVYVAEQLKGKTDPAGKLAEVSEAYKQLSASELERLEAHAAKNKLANDAAHKSWLLTHTPSEIVAANAARARLNTLEVFKKKRLFSLKDDRIPKRPNTAWTLYATSSLRAADLTTREAQTRAFKDIAAAWHAMGDAERQPYIDNAALDRARYEEEVQKVLGRGIESS